MATISSLRKIRVKGTSIEHEFSSVALSGVTGASKGANVGCQGLPDEECGDDDDEPDD